MCQEWKNKKMDHTHYNKILVHYGEIALKGGNRPYFEKKLVSNIKEALSGLGCKSIKRIFGRIIIDIEENSNIEKIQSRLKQVFGIVNFFPVIEVRQNIEEMQKTAWGLIQSQNFDTFAVDTKRSQKDFKFTSPEINDQVGRFVVENLKQQDRSHDVDIGDPDCRVNIEIVEDRAYVGLNKTSGPSGLPVTTAGKVVNLVSAGIDSPVAAWKMMKRGCKNVFCHFHAFPFTNKKSKINVERVVEKLSEWQLGTKIYFVNIGDIQKEIIKKAPADLRLIFYRRVMFKIAEKIAKKEGALGLVTGESIAQVASQTLENMHATSEAVKLPIYRPNAGDDKQEIINIAKKIGTHDITTEQVEDCCTYMVADHPETKASLENVLSIESDLALENLIAETIKKVEIVEK